MLFDSTLRRELARNFGGTLVVILTIVLTIMFIRNLGQAALGRISPQDVMLLLAYIGLGHLSTMLALSLFIAVVATLSRMYRGSEMTIWFASGVPLSRFVRPVLGHELAGAAPDRRPLDLRLAVAERTQRRPEGPVRAPLRPLARRARPVPDLGRRRADLLLRRQRQRSGDRPQRLHRRLARRRRVGDVGALRDRSRTKASGRFLVLSKGQRNEEDAKTGDKTLSRFETYRAEAGERVRNAAGGAAPRALPTVELLRHPTPPNQGELAWRIGLVLAAANMLLLGIGMSASNPRHASNWNLLFALLGFFAYYNLINLSQAWVGSGPGRPRRRARRSATAARFVLGARPALVARERHAPGRR